MNFEAIVEIARKLKLEPAELLQIFFGIGVMVLNQTLLHLDAELKAKLKELFPVAFNKMSDSDYQKLLNLLKDFIK